MFARRVFRFFNPSVRANVKLKKKSQKLLNEHLDRILAVDQFKAVQVGSNDGVSNDPLRHYITHNNWRAILIEPVPSLFAKLHTLYESNDRVTTLNAGISPSKSPLKFYTINPKARVELGVECPIWYDQLGSFERENITKHLEGILEPYIDEIDVPIKRLDDILVEYGIQDLDVLHVDAESYDLEVMKTLDLSRHKPQYIIIEHKHMDKSSKETFIENMVANGYEYVTYLDDIVFTLR